MEETLNLRRRNSINLNFYRSKRVKRDIASVTPIPKSAKLDLASQVASTWGRTVNAKERWKRKHKKHLGYLGPISFLDIVNNIGNRCESNVEKIQSSHQPNYKFVPEAFLYLKEGHGGLSGDVTKEKICPLKVAIVRAMYLLKLAKVFMIKGFMVCSSRILEIFIKEDFKLLLSVSKKLSMKFRKVKSLHGSYSCGNILIRADSKPIGSISICDTESSSVTKTGFEMLVKVVERNKNEKKLTDVQALFRAKLKEGMISTLEQSGFM